MVSYTQGTSLSRSKKTLSYYLSCYFRKSSIRCDHGETVAVVKPWENIEVTRVLSEKPADLTNAFKLKVSSLTTQL